MPLPGCLEKLNTSKHGRPKGTDAIGEQQADQLHKRVTSQYTRSSSTSQYTEATYTGYMLSISIHTEPACRANIQSVTHKATASRANQACKVISTVACAEHVARYLVCMCTHTTEVERHNVASLCEGSGPSHHWVADQNQAL